MNPSIAMPKDPGGTLPAPPEPAVPPPVPAATGAGKALAAATRAGYAADEALFLDWCTAADLAPLPATADTVAAFLTENPAAPATHRRRSSAIASLHRRSGYPSPTEHSTVTAWLRLAAGLPAEAEPPVAAERIREVLRRIPTTGWPAGLFGRRDAMLLLARYSARLSRPQLAALTTEHLTVDAAQLRLQIGAHQVALPATDDPATCPGCSWIRWRRMLHLIDHHQSATGFADILRAAAPLQQGDTHRCAAPKIRTFHQPMPVFLPLDRWGAAAAVQPRPISGRSMTTLTGEHLTGRAPQHPDPRPPAPTEPGAPQPAAAAAPPVDPTSAADRYRQGLAARRRDVTELAGVRDVLDEFDRAAAELDARIQELNDRYGL